MLVKPDKKQLNCIVVLTTVFSFSYLFLDSKANALTGLLSSQTASFSNQLTELEGTPVLTLNKYNLKTGETLTEVRFTITGSLTGSGTVRNTSAQNQTFTLTLIPSQFDLIPDANAPTVLQNNGTFSPLSSFTQIGRLRYANLVPNITTNFGPYTINNNASPQIVSFNQATDIAGFLGTGTFSFQPFTEILTAVSGGGGNIATNIVTTASTTIRVEYYGDIASASTAVPFEFSSNIGIGSFFGVMLGLSWWKRKRYLHKYGRS